MQYFMVTSKLPELTPQLKSLIPQQREMIDNMVKIGSVSFYAIAEDRSRMHVCIYAESEIEVRDMLSRMPVIDFLEPVITPLMYQLTPDLMPAFSLN